MKRLMVLVALVLVGCTEPTIDCWYLRGVNQYMGEPWYEVVGRTGRGRDDVRGPYFKTAADAEQFIHQNNLRLCGTK